MKPFGTMGLPELVINGEVRSVGRVLSLKELKKMIKFGSSDLSVLFASLLSLSFYLAL